MPETAIFKLKRIYDEPHIDDGFRVLIDRLWPRGVKKKGAGIDHWAKNVAPSAKLRKWFDHDPKKFAEFSRRYRSELFGNGIAIESVCPAGTDTVTLLFAARDEVHNHAVVLQEYLNATC